MQKQYHPGARPCFRCIDYSIQNISRCGIPLCMERFESFSIHQMVEITGLSVYTIRGWENRYSTFQPQRSATGRREYDKADLERALLLRDLVKRGHRISQLTLLPNKKLLSLLEVSSPPLTLPHSPAVARACDLIFLQKWERLKEHIHTVQLKDVSALVREFLVPLLGQLSCSVGEGTASISQEHILSSLIKEKIYTASADLRKKQQRQKIKLKPGFVLATPEGDHHDLGLLLANLLIQSHGFSTIYLGCHSPAKDLAETAHRFKTTHILIASTVSLDGGAQHDPLAYVNTVHNLIGDRCDILLAGRQAMRSTSQSTSSPFTIRDFVHLEDFLRYLGGHGL